MGLRFKKGLPADGEKRLEGGAGIGRANEDKAVAFAVDQETDVAVESVAEATLGIDDGVFLTGATLSSGFGTCTSLAVRSIRGASFALSFF